MNVTYNEHVLVVLQNSMENCVEQKPEKDQSYDKVGGHDGILFKSYLSLSLFLMNKTSKDST